MFGGAVDAAAMAHAVATYPAESCGLVIGGEYRPCQNTHHEPLTNFRVDDDLLVAAGTDLQAIIHSHPDGPQHPSMADMAAQIATAVPWGLIVATPGQAQAPLWFGDGAPRPQLIGRGFVWGVNDCYSLIRDWFLQKRGVWLPEFPREWGEWQGDGRRSGYLENYCAAGFHDLHLPRDASALRQLRAGDLAVMQILADLPNHAGVITDDGLLLHHLAWKEPCDPSRLSKVEPVGRWLPHVTNWLRHESLK